MFNSIKKMFKRAKNPKCRETFKLIQKVEDSVNRLFDEELDKDMTSFEILANCVNGIMYTEMLKETYKRQELTAEDELDNETNIPLLKRNRNLTDH